MHPAYSVILFTTASGAGYGLLIWFALFAATGFIRPTPLLGLVSLGLALALITTGLLASTFHLGRPERAWRAFSQWRTSWLSREGVAAVATYVPAAVLGIGWVFLARVDGMVAIAAWLTIVLALATVWCTGMIYQSLPTIRAWNHWLVAPIYVVLALASGGVLAVLLLVVFGILPRGVALITVSLLALAFTLKSAYWKIIDHAPRTLTAEQAIGLGALGKVSQLEPPHSQPNYVMREMGYRVARAHAVKLRRIAAWVGFAAPAALIIVAMLTLSWLAYVLLALAVVATAVGVVVERWLFFAEAEHVVMLYYGAKRA